MPAKQNRVPCPCVACNGRLVSRPTRIAHIDGRGGTTVNAITAATGRVHASLRPPQNGSVLRIACPAHLPPERLDPPKDAGTPTAASI
jgi:hypothetical protein